MVSHSKRNTTRPVFTAHERELARASWTSSSARLTRDSFLPFGSCSLCLQTARDPVACHRGDVFCRECALANLLEQKKEMRRAAKVREAAEREVEAERDVKEGEAKERAIREFEMVQAGLAPARKHGKGGEAKGEGEAEAEGNVAGLITQGTKRKFDLDEKELERISKEDVTRARAALDDEQARKPTLPSFWTPSLTPAIDSATALSARKKPKDTPICPSAPADAPHVFSAKHLITLSFTEENDQSRNSSSDGVKRLCPCCLKTLANPSKPLVAKPCGHVLCRQCAVRLVDTARKDGDRARCYVCEASLEGKDEGGGKEDGDKAEPAPKKAKRGLPEGLVELRSDGTGFSAAGSSKVERDSTNFQC